MHADPWLSLKDLPGTALRPARVELHRAVQLAACAGQSLLPQRPDDSQMALAWKAGVLLGEALPGGSRVGLAMADLALEVRDGRGGLAGRLPLNGRTPEEALKWVRVRLGGSGVDTRALKEEMPYEMPGRLLGREAPFSTESTAPFEALAAWYQAAAEALAELTAARSDAGPLRCWPHHFDLAVLLSLDRVVVPGAMADGTTGEEVVEIVDGEGHVLDPGPPEAAPPEAEAESESGRTIGVGLSPGDNSYDEPYFYVTPWPYPKGKDFPPLPAGHWHMEFWTGAVLTASELAGAEDPKARVLDFLVGAVAGCQELLG